MSLRRFAVQPHFHGWRLVGFSTISQFIAMGFSIYILGLYIQPLATEFNVSPGTLGWGMGIFYLISSAMGPLVGSWVDKGHARLVLTLGALVFALGFVLMSLVSSLWQAALVCTFLLAPGACMLGVLPCATLLVQWFERRQSFAVGIAAIGISLGGFVMPPIANGLIDALGWRTSLLVLGLFVAAFLLPLSWALVVGRPADVGQFADGDTPDSASEAGTENFDRSSEQPAVAALTAKAIVMQKTFWLLTGCIGLLSLCSIMMVTFMVPYARVAGLSSDTSALLISLYAGSAVVGKFLLGWVGDHFSRRKIMVLIQLVGALGWLCMVVWQNTAALMASAALVGFAVGGMTPLWATLIALHFGPAAFGRVKGIMTLAMTVFLIIPGPLGGYLYDRFGSYEAGFAMVWWVLPLALLCAWLLPEKRRS
ncbi:MFS transporter [Pseudomaricurvus sp. HS19]|uniref:MFS transporter n=1 Tax=Pseudomaricurvus sp. HS19 TaxID=2692626 RepID=UPI00136880FB|nr:MFS transporter [Pseudomaricurvus sp. HS19]MYM64467.1 MFS transporter [Pseudomaricurvus sp. HS19]